MEAVKWFRRAAEQGCVYGQRNLGAMYENGQGVPQSDKEAVKWYRKAAEQGNAEARQLLEKLKVAQQAETAPNASLAHSNACAYCGINAPNLKACSRCKTTSYCSKECQATHWRLGHKVACGK